MKKQPKTKKPKEVKKPVKTNTDPYCPPGQKWDKLLERCVDDIG